MHRLDRRVFMTLKNRIYKAFRDIKRPDNTEDLLSSDIDKNAVFELRSLLGKDWIAISFDDLILYDSFEECLCSLSPFLLHYYTPGIIGLIVDDHEESDMLPHAFIGRFAPNPWNDIREIEETIELFNRQQREAIIDFLNHLKQYDEYCPHVINVAIKNIDTGKVTYCSPDEINKWLEKSIIQTGKFDMC